MTFRPAWSSSEFQSSKLHSETLHQITKQKQNNNNKTKEKRKEIGEQGLLDLALGRTPKDMLETVLNLFLPFRAMGVQVVDFQSHSTNLAGPRTP